MKKIMITFTAIFATALVASAQVKEKPVKTEPVVQPKPVEEKVPVKEDVKEPKETQEVKGKVVKETQTKGDVVPIRKERTVEPTEVQQPKDKVKKVEKVDKSKLKNIERKEGKGPSMEKRAHAEERSGGHAFSGKGKGGDKNLVDPAGKKKQKKVKSQKSHKK